MCVHGPETESVDCQEIIQIMPAGGWRVKWTEKEDPDKPLEVPVPQDEPLVGWALTCSGNVVALVRSSSGFAEKAFNEFSYTSFEVYHGKEAW